MRIAVIADIHGNALALEAVLADIARHGVDAVVNLGDHLSGPLEARRTADILMARDFPSVRGNHDRYLVEQTPDQMGLSDSAAYRQLEPKHLAWLQTLPPTLVFRNEVFLCHATPTSDDTYWLESVTADATVHMTPIEQIEARAEGVNFPLILCGHSHIPRAVRLRDGRLIINPGSVGLPGYDDTVPVSHIMQSGVPDACYAIAEKFDGRWNASFRHVGYNHAAAARMAQAAGRLEWASALATGWVRP
jgi:predicted phosphodiesterase